MPASRMTWTAMCCAGLMLAHQVAGKAVRDSFFLTSYPASALPSIVIASAVVSLAVVLALSRVMGRFGPRRLIPAGFAISSLLHVAEYIWAAASPKAWAVVIYLHIAVLGAILLSGFWSQMAESFDPRTAKQVFGRIAGAGTLGGIAGGAMAERVAVLAGASNVLLLLAGFHLSCAVVLAWMRSPAAGPAGLETPDSVPARDLFRRAPYLVSIAALVLAGTASAAIVDYLFRAGAAAAVGRGVPLLRFFAIFYTSTQALTLVAQVVMARPALESLGIGRTISALPLSVGSGALAVLLFPAFPVLTFLRSLELVVRGSLFRSGYELLYTPVPPAEKRAAKTLIDVGFDRAGEAIGSGAVQLLLLLGTPFASSMLLGAVLALAAAGTWVALRLDDEYRGLVQQRLVDRAVELNLADVEDHTTRTAIISAGALPNPVPAAPERLAAPRSTTAVPDPTMELLRELRSGDSGRVLAALQEMRRPNALVAAQLVQLLAWDEVSEAVREALLRDLAHVTGLLTDHLTGGEAVPFGIRRRIPRILARGESQMCVHGLVAGLGDSRFEVRFQCSRALDLLHQRRPELGVPADAIYAAAGREFQVAGPVRESRRLLDRRDGADSEAFFDEDLRERADRSLEHVFSLLATVLPREPVKIAFRALHTEDAVLRGLALEYLEGVLPPQVRERLWAAIEPVGGPRPQRSHEEALAELLRSQDSLLLRRDRAGDGR